MEKIFITDIKINQVRHIKAKRIPLSKEHRKHLIITGKNGSGKTSLLDSIGVFLNAITCTDDPVEAMRNLEIDKSNLQHCIENGNPDDQIRKTRERIAYYEKRIENSTGGIMLEMNKELENIRPVFHQGNFIVAYYRADRIFKAQVPRHIEKVDLKKDYTINENPREEFIKYLLDLKMTEALAASGGKQEKSDKIKLWFEEFQNLLKKVFEDNSVRLEFDEDTFRFSIHMDGREPFDFNTLSSGYAAVLDIVVDLMIRMEHQSDRVFDFSIPGIVLIDEIETHLHLELQKRILELLTTIFPNIQFIVSTHSPFVLNSLESVIIYDLEKDLLVNNGLADIPYEGIVEGYFNADAMSSVLRSKYDKYKTLVYKPELTEDDFDEIAELEMYLNEIPDYLALGVTTEYQRLKMELRERKDI